MVNWHSLAETFFGAAILFFIGSYIFSFWAVTWMSYDNYESGILNYLVDLTHYFALVGLPLLAAIFCALMDIGDQLRKGGTGEVVA
jgi:hypothetical protein